MQESLYDRFRPFKPYDLVLALVMLLLVAPQSRLDPVERALTLIGGLVIFGLLDASQRLIPVPTPLWQSTSMIVASTLVVGTLIHLHSAYQYSLPLAMLNTAFATVAFGQWAGIGSALLNVFVLWQMAAPGGMYTTPLVWMLVLLVLLTLIAILSRIRRMQQDALFDEVTDLRNHRYFQDRLREELQRSERHGHATALVMLDLDNFKKVNDQYGHARGDEILHQVANVLVKSARGTDIVCRYGGEELAVILPVTPLAEAVHVAERLRRAVAEHRDEHGVAVTLSAGVAVCPEHARSADGLIEAADAAMYRAKRSGKNRVESAPPLAMPQQSG